MFFKNLALIGPPGSGKGSYGKYLSKWLDVPLVTVSDVLRQHQQQQQLENDDRRNTSQTTSSTAPTASSAALVDDTIVSEVLMEHLTKLDRDGTTGYIVDGFPRTMKQIELMNQTWQQSKTTTTSSLRHVQAAILLDVPDSICEIKLLGRRHCTVCNGNFNCHSVLDGQWDLPPTVPNSKNCQKFLVEYHHHHQGNDKDKDDDTNTSSTIIGGDDNYYCCNSDSPWWKKRDDDIPIILQERLQIYHSHMDPIIDYFQQRNRLFRFSPYKGYDDIPKLQQSLTTWFKEELEN